MTQHVLVEKSEKLLVLTLNRPDKKNALTRAMYKTLATEITNADTDPDIRCILIMANGDMFTAGNDLADFAAVGNAATAPKPEDGNPVSWGIANRAVPPSELHATARAAAIAIAARAPASVVTTKALMREQSAMLARMGEETGHFVRQLKSAEFKEAFTAFSERRAPDFSKFG